MTGVKALFQKMLLWGFGYGGMWSGKWLVGSVLMKRNMFVDALNQAIFRASPGSLQGEAYGRFDAVMKNISVFFKWPFFLLFLSGGGICRIWTSNHYAPYSVSKCDNDSPSDRSGISAGWLDAGNGRPFLRPLLVYL